MGDLRGDVLAAYWLLRSAWHTQGSLRAAALRTCLPRPAHLSGTMLCRPRFTCGEDPRVGTALAWLAQSNGVCVCVLNSLDLARSAHSLRRLLLLVQLTFSVTPSYLDSNELIVSNALLLRRVSLFAPGSSVHGILQARILEWVAMPSSVVSSKPKDQTHISCVSCSGRRVLYH